nr:MAG TPA: adenine-specific methyltransferase [Caudoviricetes sp.]
MINLMHGDCLELMKTIDDKSVDMVLCDLPYGCTAAREWDNVIPFKPLWEQYNRIIKDNGAVVLFGIEPFSSELRVSNLKNYRYDWIWKKNRGTGFLTANKLPMRSHEIISVFYKKLPQYNIQKRSGFKPYSRVRKSARNTVYQNYKCITSTYVDGERYPTSILEFPCVNQKDRMHPTQKPVELLEYLVRTYTNENDIVLDNCMGSGSTGVACKNLNRGFIGIEKDDNYFNIAKNRIENCNS